MTDPETIGTYQSVVEQYEQRNADRSAIEGLVERFLCAVEQRTNGTPARLLDIGCGPGWEIATFREHGHDVLGIDLTHEFLPMARQRAPQASFAQMDMRTLGVAAGVFDGVWACASLLHVPRKEAGPTLAEFHRALHSEGILHLSVKYGKGTADGEVYEDDTRHFVLYHPDELETIVEEAGFTITSLETDATDTWIQVAARA